ncbi:MAG TPA: RNA polymerase sigma factor [Chloroflexia bacterium]|nr:RNA polymerase sigma factor [Chloroflexia bacterium]
MVDSPTVGVQLSSDETRAIVLLRQGDIAGLEALVRLHQVRALRAAYAITGDRHAAEDVVADSFLTVYDRIHQLDERRPFTPWFYRIVVNAALKSQRRAANTAFTDDDMEWLDQQADQSPGPEEKAAMREMRHLLLAAIYTLPPKQRAALVLRYYLDMDEATIAATLRCPLGTIKWRLHSARRHLRRSLTPIIHELAYNND